MAQPMEMRSTPHHGTLSKPSTVDPAARQQERGKNGWEGGREREGRGEKVVLRKDGSRRYHSLTPVQTETDRHKQTHTNMQAQTKQKQEGAKRGRQGTSGALAIIS